MKLLIVRFFSRPTAQPIDKGIKAIFSVFNATYFGFIRASECWITLLSLTIRENLHLQLILEFRLRRSDNDSRWSAVYMRRMGLRPYLKLRGLRPTPSHSPIFSH